MIIKQRFITSLFFLVQRNDSVKISIWKHKRSMKSMLSLLINTCSENGNKWNDVWQVAINCNDDGKKTEEEKNV